MPRIQRYDAKDEKLTPDSKGYEAFETAGRRIGPLYNQAAQDVEKGGELQAQGIKASGWPLEFDRFRPSTVSIRFDSAKNAGPGRLRSTHDMSNGGPILSHIARQMVGEHAPKEPAEETIPGNGANIDYKKNELARQQQAIENAVNGVPVDGNGNPAPQINKSDTVPSTDFGTGDAPISGGSGGGADTAPSYNGVSQGPAASSGWFSPSAWFDWMGSQVGSNSPDPSQAPDQGMVDNTAVE